MKRMGNAGEENVASSAFFYTFATGNELYL